MNNDEKSIEPREDDERAEATEQKPVKQTRAQKAKAQAITVWGKLRERGHTRVVFFALCVALNIFWQTHPMQRQAPEQAAAAKIAVQAWPGALKNLEVTGVPACDGGPTLSCAAIATHRLDEVNNEQEGAVYLWAGQNWAQAWMPFAQWRVAHAVALEAPKSNYGRHLLANRSQSEIAAVSGAGFIVEPAPELAKAYKESDDADPPMRVQTDHGMVAFFADGMSLPVLEDRGQWKILAQGPADQAARMAAAMSNLADPGAVEVAAATASENAVQARLRLAAKAQSQALPPAALEKPANASGDAQARMRAEVAAAAHRSAVARNRDKD